MRFSDYTEETGLERGDAMTEAQPLILTATNTFGRVKEITDHLENGVREVFESGKYEEYLSTMAKFHNYSLNNTLLISMQMPDASYVAGFNSWKNNFGRTVKKGEKGIKILAPSPYKIKTETTVLEDGKEMKEEKEVTIPAFKPVTVFDISQTEGKDLPDITAPLLGSVERYETLIIILKSISPVPIYFRKMNEEQYGYYSRDLKEIAIREGLSELHTVKTAIHEIAHALLHDGPNDKEPPKDRRTKEVEAESVAYTVCQHFGLNTSEYSFSYIAGWSGDRETKQLRDSLETIRKTASSIISQIETNLN